MAYLLSKGTIRRSKQYAPGANLPIWSSCKDKKTGFSTNNVEIEEVPAGYKVLGYEPTRNSTSAAEAPAVTNISFSNSTSARRVTLQFEDTRSKEIMIYYYRSSNYTQNVCIRSINTAGSGLNGGTHYMYTHVESEGTEIKDNYYSTISSANSVTMNCIPHFKSSGSSLRFYSGGQSTAGTVLGIIDSTGGQTMTTATWDGDTDSNHQSTYNVTCTSGVNAFITIRYEDSSYYTYFLCHFEENYVQPSNF